MSARNEVLTEAADVLQSVSEQAQRAATQLRAVCWGLPSDTAELNRAADAIAAESHRLVLAGLNARAAAARLSTVSIFEKEGGKR